MHWPQLVCLHDRLPIEHIWWSIFSTRRHGAHRIMAATLESSTWVGHLRKLHCQWKNMLWVNDTTCMWVSRIQPIATKTMNESHQIIKDHTTSHPPNTQPGNCPMPAHAAVRESQDWPEIILIHKGWKGFDWLLICLFDWLIDWLIDWLMIAHALHFLLFILEILLWCCFTYDTTCKS